MPYSQGYPSTGITGLRGGGEIPMVYANGRYIPAYGWGKWIKRLSPLAGLVPVVGAPLAGGLAAFGSSLEQKEDTGEWGGLGSSLMSGIEGGLKAVGVQKAKGGIKDLMGSGPPAIDYTDPSMHLLAESMGINPGDAALEEQARHWAGVGARAGGSKWYDKLWGWAKENITPENAMKYGPLLSYLENPHMRGAAPSGRVMSGISPASRRAAPASATIEGFTPDARPWGERLFGAAGGMVPQYDVGNMYANRRFSGGMVPGYRRGGEYDEPERGGYRRPRSRGRGRAPVRRPPPSRRRYDLGPPREDEGEPRRDRGRVPPVRRPPPPRPAPPPPAPVAPRPQAMPILPPPPLPPPMSGPGPTAPPSPGGGVRIPPPPGEFRVPTTRPLPPSIGYPPAPPPPVRLKPIEIDPAERARSEAHARAEGKRRDAERKMLKEMKERGRAAEDKAKRAIRDKAAAEKKAAAARKKAEADKKRVAAAKKKAEAEQKRADAAKEAAEQEDDPKRKAVLERKAATADRKVAAINKTVKREEKRVVATNKIIEREEKRVVATDKRIKREEKRVTTATADVEKVEKKIAAAPPPPAITPPAPPPTDREEEEREDMRAAIPETVAAAPPPPPVAPPLVEEFGDEFDEPTLPPPPPIRQPQPPPGVPVFDPRQVDVENRQAELAAQQQQAASQRQPPPVFDPTQVGPLDQQLATEGDGGEPPGMGPPPVPRARPQPQPEPFVDDEEPIDQQLAGQLPYTVPQPAAPPPQQGPQPPAGVPVFDPRQVDLQNAIEQQKAQERAVAQGAKPFVPSPEEEGNGNGATEGPGQFEPSRTGVPEPEPTARVNVPRQLTEEQRDNLDETIFDYDDTDTVMTEFGEQKDLYGEEPEETFTPETDRPAPVIEPPAGVDVFDPSDVVEKDEEERIKAEEKQLYMQPGDEEQEKRLEKIYEEQAERDAKEVEKTGEMTGPSKSAEGRLEDLKKEQEAVREAEAERLRAAERSRVSPAGRYVRPGDATGIFRGPTGGPTEAVAPPPIYEASGYDPFNMPTTAAQFTAAGDQGTADMLTRMNPAVPFVAEDYTPTPPKDDATLGKAEGGVIDELGDDEAARQTFEILTLQALRILMTGESSGPVETRQLASIVSEYRNRYGDQALAELVQMVEASDEGPRGALPMVPPSMTPTAPMSPQGQSGLRIPRLPMQVGGLIPGNGDAMADDIITTADAGTPTAQDIAISSGEYVVAGDVVSGLGSGNSEAGAEVLDQFQEDVRMDRTGSPVQPPPIDLSEVLPATYGQRYA